MRYRSLYVVHDKMNSAKQSPRTSLRPVRLVLYRHFFLRSILSGLAAPQRNEGVSRNLRFQTQVYESHLGRSSNESRATRCSGYKLCHPTPVVNHCTHMYPVPSTSASDYLLDPSTEHSSSHHAWCTPGLKLFFAPPASSYILNSRSTTNIHIVQIQLKHRSYAETVPFKLRLFPFEGMHSRLLTLHDTIPPSATPVAC
jgi:hypothetical protein